MSAASQSVDFIRRELIPEMVHARCFCEPGSREFVEFDSADVEPYDNEEMFYSKMTLEYGTDVYPKCYLSDSGRYGRPVIALADLTARGYVRVDRKLDEDHLKLCVRALATFHGRGLRLRADKFAVFREFYAKLSRTGIDEDPVGCHRQNPVRILGVLKLLSEPQLVGKIKGKLSESPLDVMESLAAEINDVSTVCHGSFSRDNVLFRHENGKPSDVKVIDWQTMRYCSPAIDLGLILFSNLPDGEPSTVGPFCRDTLRLYLDAVKREYPELACELLERDIIVKLLYAYVILCNDRSITDDELATMLRVLDDLGTFD